MEAFIHDKFGIVKELAASFLSLFISECKMPILYIATHGKYTGLQSTTKHEFSHVTSTKCGEVAADDVTTNMSIIEVANEWFRNNTCAFWKSQMADMLRRKSKIYFKGEQESLHTDDGFMIMDYGVGEKFWDKELYRDDSLGGQELLLYVDDNKEPTDLLSRLMPSNSDTILLSEAINSISPTFDRPIFIVDTSCNTMHTRKGLVSQINTDRRKHSSQRYPVCESKGTTTVFYIDGVFQTSNSDGAVGSFKDLKIHLSQNRDINALVIYLDSSLDLIELYSLYDWEDIHIIYEHSFIDSDDHLYSSRGFLSRIPTSTRCLRLSYFPTHDLVEILSLFIMFGIKTNLRVVEIDKTQLADVVKIQDLHKTIHCVNKNMRLLPNIDPKIRMSEYGYKPDHDVFREFGDMLCQQILPQHSSVSLLDVTDPHVKIVLGYIGKIFDVDYDQILIFTIAHLESLKEKKRVKNRKRRMIRSQNKKNP